jgi:hypothetical protein
MEFFAYAHLFLICYPSCEVVWNPGIEPEKTLLKRVPTISTQEIPHSKSHQIFNDSDNIRKHQGIGTPYML